MEKHKARKTVKKLYYNPPQIINEWTRIYRHHMVQSQSIRHHKRDTMERERDICSKQQGSITANNRKLRTPTLSTNLLKYSGAKCGHNFSSPWSTNPSYHWCQAPYCNRQQEADTTASNFGLTSTAWSKPPRHPSQDQC